MKPEVPGEHGLPKPSVPEVFVGRTGLQGDFNRYRHEQKADDAAMAVLIVPRETLAELEKEGWPVRPGDLGENITTEGIAYDAFVPGRRFRVGDAELEVSKACTPCDNLYLLPYVGPARGPEFLKVMLDRRGWYARVVREGRIRVGDRVGSAD
ncbi:MAG: MOSC domain-containing protein [Thermoplasmata archaeon]